MSPAAAASTGVPARAREPSSATRSASVSGPRLLLTTTSWPASTASRARVPPMCPAPMSPMVVMPGPIVGVADAFPDGLAEADGNRTHQTEVLGLNGFEDRAAHQDEYASDRDPRRTEVRA